MNDTADNQDVAHVRDAREADLPAITAIYEHHVLHGVASFEEVPPALEEMQRRYAAIRERGLPYLVAELGGSVAGYAYAGPYRPRPAYRHTVEDSVYLRPELIGRGLGRLLLGELIVRCEALGLRQMVGIIGGRETVASIALHERMGFRHVGVLEAVGYKFGRWLPTLILQRELGVGAAEPPDAPKSPGGKA
jgi:L-amino acid N-acyltransferase YncA